MKKNIYNILKLICLFACLVFLLTACGDNPEASLGGDEGVADDYKALDQSGSCWQGSLVKQFYSMLGTVSIEGFSHLTSGCMQLMAVAFSLWLAYQILRHVSATSPESLGEFWTKAIRKAALCVVCGILASSTGGVLYALNTFVFPIYVTLLEFGSRILDVIDTDPTANAKAMYTAVGDGQCRVETYTAAATTSCSLTGKTIGDISGKEFPVEPGLMMQCMTCKVADRLIAGLRLGLSSMLGHGFMGFIVGIMVVFAFLIAWIGFALYIIDSIFRLAMMVVIAPFLILSFAFEQTRKWTTVGFKYMLNSSAIMLCLVVLVSMTIMAMQAVLSDSSVGDIGNDESYKSLGIVPIVMMFMGFMIVKATGMAVELSDSITGGGGGTAFQKKMAALAGTIAKAILAYATAGMGKAVTNFIEKHERLKAAADAVKKARNKMNSLAGRQNKQQGGQQ